MKKTIVIIFIILSNTLWGQSISQKLERADSLVELKKYDKAIILYKDICQSNIISPLTPYGFLGLANTYLELKDTINAISIYNNILLLKENNYFTNTQKKIRNPILPKIIKKQIIKKAHKNEERIYYYPIFVAKNEASVNLGEIYFSKKDYRKALYYFSLSDSVYKYQHFCGNAFAANDIYLATKYSQCYLGLSNIDSAIFYLTPYIFENGLADNSSIIYLFDKIIKSKYSSEEINLLLENAESTIFLIKNEKDNIIIYHSFINLFNQTIEIPTDNDLFLLYYSDFNHEINDDELKIKYIKIFKNTTIYKRLYTSR